MAQVPKHWQRKKLQDVCRHILGGGTPSTKKPEYWDGKIPWVSSADVYGLRDIRPRRTVTKKGIDESTTNLLPKGGIIVVTRVGLGKIAIAPYDLCFSQDSQGLVLDEKQISKSYALLCLSKAVQMFRYQGQGTTISGVTKKQLKEVEVPLPPMKEQERIVAKIEELFSELDAGVEALKKAQAQLKTYRQSVLKHAFEGRLTNANIKDGELPDGWDFRKLDSLGDLGRGKSKHRPRNDKKLFGGSYPFIQTGEVKAAGKVISSFEKTYSEFGLEQSKLWPQGTLCITIAANIAEVAFLGFEGCFPDSVVGFTADSNQVLPHYVFYFFKGNQRHLESFAPATAQKNINLNTLENLMLPYCDFDEQQRIVAEIESRLSVCDKMEDAIRAGLKQSEALRQSILKKAFEGKLI